MKTNRTWLKLSVGVVALTLCVLIAEVVVRVHFARYIGPRVLFYGTPLYRNEIEDRDERNKQKYLRRYYRDRTVEFHEEAQEGYTRFFPNEVKLDKDPDTSDTFRVRINGRGFRGPEFDVDKHGAVRVLTLGRHRRSGITTVTKPLIRIIWRNI